MKKAFYLLTLLVAMMMTSRYEAKATHAGGADLIYEWIADSTYRIYFKLYRDCSGITEPNTMNACLENTCTGLTQNVTLNLHPGSNGAIVSPLCYSNMQTQCTQQGSPLPGFREWTYYGLVQLNGRCSNWKMTVGVSDRNTSMNIQNAMATSMLVQSTFSDSLIINSSPYYQTKPIVYARINQPFAYNNLALDVDGDSLVTEVTQPLGINLTMPCGSYTALPLAATTPAYNWIDNPFQTNNTFMLDGPTGQMIFTPTMLGSQALTLHVKEYRNGSLIATHTREVQVQVGPPVTPTPAMELISVMGGKMVNDTLKGVQGIPLDFCYYVKSLHDTNAQLVVMDDHMLSLAGSTGQHYNQHTDSVTGCILWYPGAADTGSHVLTVLAYDSSCNAVGSRQYYKYEIPVYIAPQLSVKDAAKAHNISIYPNPNSGRFSVTASDIQARTAELEVLNAVGQLIHKQTIRPQGGKIHTELQLHNAAPGLHLLRIRGEGTFTTIPFTISK